MFGGARHSCLQEALFGSVVSQLLLYLSPLNPSSPPLLSWLAKGCGEWGPPR